MKKLDLKIGLVTAIIACMGIQIQTMEYNPQVENRFNALVTDIQNNPTLAINALQDIKRMWSTEMIRQLLTMQDASGKNILRHAVSIQNINLVNTILGVMEQYLSKNSRNMVLEARSNNATALHSALYSFNPDLVQVLLAAKANPAAKFRGQPPLIFALKEWEKTLPGSTRRMQTEKIITELLRYLKFKDHPKVQEYPIMAKPEIRTLIGQMQIRTAQPFIKPRPTPTEPVEEIQTPQVAQKAKEKEEQAKKELVDALHSKNIGKVREILSQDEAIVRKLLIYDINKWPALIIAIENDFDQAISAILSKAFDLDLDKFIMKEAFQKAIWNIKNLRNTANTMLTHGVDPNINLTAGITPLMEISNSGSTQKDLELLQRLINLGADVNKKDNFGQTALDFAEKSRENAPIKQQIITTLERAGAVRKQPRPGQPQFAQVAPLPIAKEGLINAAIKNNTLIVEQLIDQYKRNYNVTTFARLLIEAKDDVNRNVLRIAVRNNNLELVNFILSKIASLNISDRKQVLEAQDSANNTTALHSAIQKRSTDIIEALLRHGADPNATLAGDTALHMAIAQGLYDIANNMLMRGANPNVKTSANKTPIQLAIDAWINNPANRSTIEETVRRLIEYGAHVGGELVELQRRPQFERLTNIIQEELSKRSQQRAPREPRYTPFPTEEESRYGRF